jgi:hypothetical protein
MIHLESHADARCCVYPASASHPPQNSDSVKEGYDYCHHNGEAEQNRSCRQVVFLLQK